MIGMVRLYRCEVVSGPGARPVGAAVRERDKRMSTALVLV